MPGAASSETLEGYVVDVACVRKHARGEQLERAERHTKKCALMGHCVESGYALVSEHGVVLLDTKATTAIVDTLLRTRSEQGIRLRVTRERNDNEMDTVRVEEISTPPTNAEGHRLHVARSGSI